ncbi:ATP-binding protein [Pedobacter sp. Du54]|uniref:ATP-binding response regulator n=1 Tax=Pedobacter anseongensis TaxID=3133439 RepID=UPI00309A50E6
MTTLLNVLILEDNKSDADLLCRELSRSGLNFTAKIIQTRVEFEESLANFNADVILSDYALPAFDAVSAFRIKQKKHAHIPFIIVSGVIGEENAVELIKDGVTDYVSKQKLFTLFTKINRALNDTAERNEKIVIAEKLKLQTVELITANTELALLNQELEARVMLRTKALADSESRFRNMMEAIPQIAWTNALKGDVIFYNQRWCDYTGFTESKHFYTVIHREDRKICFDQFYAILKTNSGGEFQIRAKRSDGTYRWHLIRLMPILDEQKQIQLWVGTATDIQELRLLQQQKDDFISIASHELKTPITSLKASLQLLDRIKNKPPTSMLPILISQANKSLNKVNTLIADLLDASLANKGQLHINQQSFNIHQLIKECCLDVHLDDKYTFKIEGDKEIAVFADSIRIEQIVVNFINNAVKYAPNSTEIVIRIEKIAQEVKVAVVDKGPGIPSEKLSRLFDRYYRADTSGSQYTGLGLGLYICSEIIKKHGGKIGVDSTLGKGSAFWFILPMAS